MRSGTIELASGRWYWALHEQWTGATVVFQHRHRVHDELRSWTPHAELTQEEARELARDAFERLWVDADGLKWRLALELPVGALGREEANGSGGELALVFRRGGLKRVIAVSEATRLGEFTHGELAKLLGEAANRFP